MSSNTNYPKVCVQCGAHFTAKKLSTQFCSHRCSSLAYKQKKRKQKITIAKVDVKNHSLPPIKHQKISNQIRPSANNLSTLNEREYLSVVETATLMGVCKSTINKYCALEKLKCIKMNRKIFIRRSDIEELFNAAPRYEVIPRNRESSGVVVVETQMEERQEQTTTPITDYISAREAAELFGETKDAIHSRARTNKVPSVTRHTTLSPSGTQSMISWSNTR
ncbi:MAG: helix-turn-helix domain-containing protein [Rikenellaceae bacterium]